MLILKNEVKKIRIHYFGLSESVYKYDGERLCSLTYFWDIFWGTESYYYIIAWYSFSISVFKETAEFDFKYHICLLAQYLLLSSIVLGFFSLYFVGLNKLLFTNVYFSSLLCNKREIMFGLVLYWFQLVPL